MPAIEGPEVFILSLEYRNFLDEVFSTLMAKLLESALVKRAKSQAGAIRYLQNNNPSVIFVADEGLTKRNYRQVLEMVQSYAQGGGHVVFALHFPAFFEGDAFDRFFIDAFNLPWKRGDYHRATFEYNPTCTLPAMVDDKQFPAPCSMKVCHIKDARRHEKIFVPVGGAMTESHVFPPSPVDHPQAAVVGAKIGERFVSFIGDVNGELGADMVILALCGIRG